MELKPMYNEESHEIDSGDEPDILRKTCKL